MASNIVLPTLTAWAEQHITALFTATDEATFDGAFDAFFTKDAKITVNSQTVSLADYKKAIWQAKFAEAGAQVAFAGAVQIPFDADKPFDAGSVGLFLQGTIDQKFLVLGAPESSTVTASYNLTIIQDPSIPRPTGPIHGFYDPRRVSVLNKVSLDKRNPISLPVNPGTETASS